MKVIHEISKSEVEELITNFFSSLGYEAAVILNEDGSATVKADSDLADYF